MKILLTGAAGFTGRHFASAARSAGHEVVALVSDLRDAAAVRHEVARACPQAVVHLGGIAHAAYADERALYDVNLFGTLNLLEALKALPAAPRKVLLASSANVYGNATQSPVAESAPPAPVNHYAMTKLAMEHMSRSLAPQLPTIVARPFNYTGPGQSTAFVIPKLVDAFRQRAPLLMLGNIHVQREYNDVRMVCEAYLRLLDLGEPGSTYNICTGRMHDLQAVLAALQSLTGHEIEIQVDPRLVRPNEVHQLCGDPAWLHRAIGALQAPSLHETLRWMLTETAA